MVANIAEKQEPQGLMAKFAGRFDMDAGKMMTTLKATAFKVKNGEVTNEQMAALVIVADQYGLNPFTKEIYAFPDKQNGIVPVVGVDGWNRIINDNKNTDGIEFRYSDNTVTMDDAKPCPEWCEAIIYRKDRDKPTVIREYLDEVYRPPFKGRDGYVANGPWQTHTKRMLRHKALIQAARVGFSFSGIYDEDEAQRIVDVTPDAPAEPARPEREEYPQEAFESNLPAWTDLIESGKKTAADIIAAVESKAVLSDEQRQALTDIEITDGEITDEDS